MAHICMRHNLFAPSVLAVSDSLHSRRGEMQTCVNNVTRHATRMTETGQTYKCVKTHMRMSHETHTHVACSLTHT